MDTLTLNFDALQRLSETLPKKGDSLRLSKILSLRRLSEEQADVIEQTASFLDAVAPYISTEWGSLSDEQRELCRLMVELAESSLKALDESGLEIQLFLLIPSIRRRKNLHKLLRRSTERLASAVSDAASAWEAERKRKFEEAASYVLQKNAELHRRLA